MSQINIYYFAAIWCMSYGNNTCQAQCKHAERERGKLVIDGDVCPFQYFCKCSCPFCSEECVSQGMIHVPKHRDMFGCSICNCQCDKNLNCWKTCNGPKFQLKNNTFGCYECRCECLDVNCDEKCNGIGQAIIKKDKTGCHVCDGCKSQKSAGK